MAEQHYDVNDSVKAKGNDQQERYFYIVIVVDLCKHEDIRLI